MSLTKQQPSTSTTDDTISLTDTIKITSNGTGYSTIDYGAIPSLTVGSSTGYTYTNTPTSLGSANAIWTTSGTGTGMPAWSGVGSTIGSTIGAGGKITLNGKDADVDINGKSLKAWMEAVEQRLNILTTNPELEAEWDELRELGERYREVEKLCKEKAEAWNKLKKL